jgi:hypothetical protein
MLKNVPDESEMMIVVSQGQDFDKFGNGADEKVGRWFPGLFMFLSVPHN